MSAADGRVARLARGTAELGLALDAPVLEDLLAYLDLLAKWNRVYNLTALRDPEQMLTHHLLDSADSTTVQAESNSTPPSPA